MQSPDWIGVRDLALVEDALGGEKIAQHESDFERRHRALVRRVDIDDDLAALEIAQRVTHLSSAIEVIESMRALGHPGYGVRANSRTGRDHEKIVSVTLAGLGQDRLLVGVDVLGRIDEIGHTTVQHLALIAEQLRFAHSAERHVKNALPHSLQDHTDRDAVRLGNRGQRLAWHDH